MRRVCFIVAYLVLIALFTAPFVRWSAWERAYDQKRNAHRQQAALGVPFPDKPQYPSRVWGLLIVPSLPFWKAVSLMDIDCPNANHQYVTPLYLAVLLWPFLALGFRPEFATRARFRSSVLAYSGVVAIVLVYAVCIAVGIGWNELTRPL